MAREICKDAAFLPQKAVPATSEDLRMAAELLETLEHHKDGCVGMAANMIGVNKRIITFDNEGTYTVMFNPEIICSIRKSSKSQGLIRQRRAAFPSPASTQPSGGVPSRCAGKTRSSKSD